MAIDVRPYWDFEDPAGSETRLREAADAATGRERLVFLTQVARALGLQSRYDECSTLLDEVASTGGSDGEVAVRVALEQGRMLRSKGDPADARPLFEEAARLAAEGGPAAGLEALHIDALHMLAMVEPVVQRQLDINREALDLARASTDPVARGWEPSLLNNIGVTLQDQGDLVGALAVFEQALAARERSGGRREIQIARWMVGWTLRLLGRRDEALAIQRGLKAELDADGIVDEYVDEELAALQPGPGD